MFSRRNICKQIIDLCLLLECFRLKTSWGFYEAMSTTLSLVKIKCKRHSRLEQFAMAVPCHVLFRQYRRHLSFVCEHPIVTTSPSRFNHPPDGATKSGHPKTVITKHGYSMLSHTVRARLVILSLCLTVSLLFR